MKTTPRAGAAPRDAAEEQEALKARTASLEMELAHKNFLLQQGFEKFIEAAEKLQESHQRLQQKVDELNLELDGKNKELEKNLQEKEEVKAYLSNIFESLAIGVLVTDLDGRITSVNRTGQEMLGTEARSAVGTPINNLLGVDLVLPAGKTEAPPRPAVQEEPVNYRRDEGEELKLQLSSSVMRGEREEPLGFIFNVQDVTQLKKLEEDAERRNRFTAMGEMAANIAHEIRNPLGSIELFTSLVKKSLDDEDENATLMKHISSNVASMNHLISNLLSYTKPRPSSRQRADVHELLRSVAEISQFMASQRKVAVHLSLDAERAAVLGDSEQLKQVFNNLLLNALQAMPEGGSVSVTSRNLKADDPKLLARFKLEQAEDGGGVELIEVTVKDSGTGIAKDIQNKIFDPFFTTKDRGTGLGLAIVHNIIESHNAAIDLESQADHGSKFTIMFPLIKD